MGDSKINAPYGTWESNISISLLASSAVSLDAALVNETSGQIYLIETCPYENGRTRIIEFTEQQPGSPWRQRCVLPAPFDAKSHVHEYGGGAVAIDRVSGKLVFTDSTTKGVFLLDPQSGQVQSVFEANLDVYYGDFDIHSPPGTAEGISILAVQEDHSENGGLPSKVRNSVVQIIPDAKPTTIASGASFYSHPRYSPDGKYVIWLQWDVPDMPWDGAELHVANRHSDGTIYAEYVIAGRPNKESVSQPRWAPDGSLLFVCDTSGYWQLYRHDLAAKRTTPVVLSGLENSEFAAAEVFLGSRTFASLTSQTVVAAFIHNAEAGIAVIDLPSNTYKVLDLPYVSVHFSGIHRLSDTQFSLIASTETSPMSLSIHGIDTSGRDATLKSALPLDGLDSSIFSPPRSISYPRLYSGIPGEAYGIFWPPHNPRYQASTTTLPPAIVSVHGGPIYHTSPGLSLECQFWTSRGYAFVEVNHAGSTGYGQAYRNLLKGKWGVIDTADIASCVAYLVKEGLIDPKKVGITGGSAGGYAVLQSMAEYPNIWAGGISLYGVSCLASIEAGTHKFESRFLEGLLLDPEDQNCYAQTKESIYRSRSPLYHVSQITAPLLLLQGAEDKVVPPSQALEMADAMKSLGRETKVVLLEGEGHGFIKSESLVLEKEEELHWWRKTLVGMAEHI